MLARVLCIPDLHCPAEHPGALDFLRRVQDKWKPDRILCLGDEIDAHSFSLKFSADPDLPSPGHELEQAMEALQKFYWEFPNADVMTSNHQNRIYKKALHAGLPRAVIRAYKEIIGCPETWNYFDDLDIDGVAYSHGEAFNSTSWRTGYNRVAQSMVIGHLHSNAGINYSQRKTRKLFSMNCGWLGDVTKLNFGYAAKSIDKGVLGCGFVIDGEEAYFIPFS